MRRGRALSHSWNPIWLLPAIRPGVVLAENGLFHRRPPRVDFEQRSHRGKRRVELPLLIALPGPRLWLLGSSHEFAVRSVNCQID